MWQYNYDYLSHHGILGQKWGIRRFQNPDGSLTAAGKKRYGANSIKEISSTKGLIRRMKDTQKYGLSNLDELAKVGADMAARTQKSLKLTNKEIKETAEAEAAKIALDKHYYVGPKEQFLETITKPCLEAPESIDSYLYSNDEKLRKAADVGVKALSKLNTFDKDWMKDFENDKESFRDWFMESDQTIGYPVVSDLVVNKGFTPKQIKSLCKIAEQNFGDSDDYYISDKCQDALFQLSWDTPEKYSEFASYCEQIKKGG